MSNRDKNRNKNVDEEINSKMNINWVIRILGNSLENPLK